MNLCIYAVGKNQVDYAWEHGKQIINDDNKCYVKCNYCGHLVKGITRLKYHLGKVKGIIKVCTLVPKAVSDGFRDNFEEDPDLKILRLKKIQNRVPPVQDGHGLDVRQAFWL